MRTHSGTNYPWHLRRSADGKDKRWKVTPSVFYLAPLPGLFTKGWDQEEESRDCKTNQQHAVGVELYFGFLHDMVRQLHAKCLLMFPLTDVPVGSNPVLICHNTKLIKTVNKCLGEKCSTQRVGGGQEIRNGMWQVRVRSLIYCTWMSIMPVLLVSADSAFYRRREQIKTQDPKTSLFKYRCPLELSAGFSSPFTFWCLPVFPDFSLLSWSSPSIKKQ